MRSGKLTVQHLSDNMKRSVKPFICIVPTVVNFNHEAKHREKVEALNYLHILSYEIRFVKELGYFKPQLLNPNPHSFTKVLPVDSSR